MRTIEPEAVQVGGLLPAALGVCSAAAIRRSTLLLGARSLLYGGFVGAYERSHS
jgi:hypothetical protein